MKRRGILRESRLMHAAVGATILAAPASAALADAPHTAPAQADGNQAAPALKARLRSHRLHYGQAVVVYGRAPVSDAGQLLALEFVPAGSTSWRQIASGQIGTNGAFRLTAPLRSSGSVRVTTTSPAGTSPLAMTSSGAPAATGTAASTEPQRVAVADWIRIRRRAREVFGQRKISVRGQLLPRSAGQRVILQARVRGRWATLASARTRTGGRFALRYLASIPGQDPLRVRFPGDRSNAATEVSAGPLTVFHPTVASWYYDAGTTGCGFHAYYGVANVSLPCGSRVSFSYNGRTVQAVVDDRGPYVGGRVWDLNQNTAAALGFAGVGTVWSSQ